MKGNIFRGFGLVLLCTSALVWLAPAEAQADEAGAAIMAELDSYLTEAKDQYFVFDMITKEPGKTERVMKFRVTIKGTRFRRVEFFAPADVRGMRFLVRSLTQMYVYLPAYRRVRRIASHVRAQGFMGSTYSFDEMSIVTYGDVFACDLASQTDSLWTLKCQRRPGQDFNYSQMEIDIRKDIHRPAELRFLSDKGALLKTETRTDYSCQEGKHVCNPKTMKIVDHARAGVSTALVCKEWKLNQGINDRYFTVRALQRGK